MTQQDSVNVIWEPLEGSQTLALSCPCDEILYEGTRGPGKSDTTLMRFAIRVGLGYGQYWRGVIFRKEYKDLEDIISKSKRWFPLIFPGAKFLASKGDLKWVFETGEELMFRNFKKEDDYWSYHGQELPFIAWEELTAYGDDKCYESMMSCNRSSFQVPEDKKHILPPIPVETFSTTNPYGPGHCLPYGEVLTNGGWKDIRDISVGDMVLTMNNNGTSFYSPVSDTLKEKYSGGMITRKGRGLNLEFTENHRLPHRNKNGFSVKHFYDLPNQANIVRSTSEWVGYSPDFFTLPEIEARKTKLNQPKRLEWKDYCQLMGWFISEGHTLDRDKEFGISQIKQPQRDNIKSLLNKIGFDYRESKSGFQISCPHWHNYLSQYGKCRDKFLNRNLLNSAKDDLILLFECLMAGDGAFNKKGVGGTYFTTSKQLSDGFEELCIKIGYNVYTSRRQRDNRSGLSYQVNFSGAKDIQLNTGNSVYKNKTSNNNVNITRNKFDGYVYCITVPETEVFFVRQKGCVWLSGNSWVKRRFIDIAPPGKIVKREYKVKDLKTQKDITLTRHQVRIFGSYSENPYLDPTYVAKLLSIKDPNKRKAWIEGDWNVTSGGRFDHLWNESVHVVKPFKIPVSWHVDRSHDWGEAKPFSNLWFAESDGTDYVDSEGGIHCTTKGDVFVIAEWYGNADGEDNEGLYYTSTKVAKGVKWIDDRLKGVEVDQPFNIKGTVNITPNLIKKDVKPGPADNAINNTSDGQCIADKMRSEGVRWTASDKRPGSRVNGAALLCDYLEAALEAKEKESGVGEKPGLYFFDNCRGVIGRFPALPRCTKSPDDIDTDAPDHDYDALRYRISSKKRSNAKVSLG